VAAVPGVRREREDAQPDPAGRDRHVPEMPGRPGAVARRPRADPGAGTADAAREERAQENRQEGLTVHGTWKVTGGAGGGGAVAFAAAAAAVAGVEWVIAWLWLIALVAAACGALAAAAAMWLGAWCERRAVLATVRWPVQQQLRAEVPGPVTPPRRVTAAGGVTVNIINPTADQQAAVIRAITRGGEPWE
jgi:hypothetical protein